MDESWIQQVKELDTDYLLSFNEYCDHTAFTLYAYYILLSNPFLNSQKASIYLLLVLAVAVVDVNCLVAVLMYAGQTWKTAGLT